MLRLQLKSDLFGVTPDEAARLMIAYEPVWAIGVSGVPATKEYAAEMHAVIRATLMELFGAKTGAGHPATLWRKRP